MRIDTGSCGDQNFRNGGESFIRSIVQGSPTSFTGWIDVRAFVDQQFYDVWMIFETGYKKRCPAIGICDVHVGAFFQKENHQISISIFRGIIQGCQILGIERINFGSIAD